MDYISSTRLVLFDLAGQITNGWLGIIIGAVLFFVAVALEITEARKSRRVHKGCPFCEAARGKAITTVVRRWRWRGMIALEPLDPVAQGHLLIISRWHSRDAGEDPRLAGKAMRCAAEMVAEIGDANIITSKGPAATQSIMHTHLHVVPRFHGDELLLPWGGQVDLTSRRING